MKTFEDYVKEYAYQVRNQIIFKIPESFSMEWSFELKIGLLKFIFNDVIPSFYNKSLTFYIFLAWVNDFNRENEDNILYQDVVFVTKNIGKICPDEFINSFKDKKEVKEPDYKELYFNLAKRFEQVIIDERIFNKNI
jgi:hypothetical protein